MIYIVHDDFSFTRYLLGVLANDSNIVLVPIKKEGYFARRMLLINRTLGFTLFSPLILKRKALAKLAAIKPTDTLIFFDYLTYDNVKTILKRIDCRNIHFWFWNTVDKYTSPVFRFHDGNTRYHTFDSFDAERYGMVLHRQIYRMPYEGDFARKDYEPVDFFFIGKNKGRLDLLMEMSRKLREWGYTTRFVIVDKHLKAESCEGITVMRKEMPYADVMAMSKRARVLVDITKKNQKGMTLRCVEGLFLNKKILSNNMALADSEIYAPENVMLFDGTLKKEDIDAFMSAQPTPYPPELQDKYSVSAWLENILKS